MKLSDAFENNAYGCLEMIVRVININFGYNRELFGKCRSLYGYAYFIDQIRQNLAVMELERAVETAVNECIEKNILKELEISENIRGENLTLEQYAKISNKL